MAKTAAELDRDIAAALVKDVTENALEAFWKVVAKSYPSAKSGDLSPGADFTLNQAAEAAVAEWVDENVPAKFRK